MKLRWKLFDFGWHCVRLGSDGRAMEIIFGIRTLSDFSFRRKLKIKADNLLSI